MIVDAARISMRRARPLARVSAIPSQLALGGLVTISFAVRLVAALGHSSPRLLPDEYVYFSLARSISHGSLTIRGHAAHFPALLEPLLAAPLWLVGGDDPELVYRLTQGLHAFAVSLVAVPVYLLARRTGAAERVALVCAGFALVLPALVFASFITADAVALTLAVGAVAAGTAALEHPTRRAQLAFLGLAGLATFARVQYAVLPVAFVIAALVVERGRVRRVLSTYRLTLVLLALSAAAALAAGPARVLGYYRGVGDLRVQPLAVGHWLITDAMLLAYAAGWVLVPVALVGLVLGIASPRSRAELAFAALVAPLAGLLLLEAGVYASNGSDRFQERYLIALLPLVPVLFVCGARRLDRRNGRLAAAGISLLLFVVATLVPLSSYTVFEGKQDSPTLLAVFQLERSFGYGDGSLTVAVAAGTLALVAAGCALRPRRGAPVLAVLALVLLGTASKAAINLDARLSTTAQRTYVGRGLVDDKHLGRVSVLELPYSSRSQISEQLFWNTSLTEILRMPDSDEVDAFGFVPVTIARDGRILARGRAITNTLLVEEYGASARLEGARLVRRTVTSALWRPAGTPRLTVLTAGRYLDGWFAAYGDVTVWPKPDGPRRGVLRLVFSLPTGLPAATLDLRGPGVRRVVRVAPGSTRVVELPAIIRNPWRIHIRTRQPFLADGGRLVSVRAKIPIFVEQTVKPQPVAADRKEP